jgi:hypothetical protein
MSAHEPGIGEERQLATPADTAQASQLSDLSRCLRNVRTSVPGQPVPAGADRNRPGAPRRRRPGTRLAPRHQLGDGAVYDRAVRWAWRAVVIDRPSMPPAATHRRPSSAYRLGTPPCPENSVRIGPPGSGGRRLTPTARVSAKAHTDRPVRCPVWSCRTRRARPAGRKSSTAPSSQRIKLGVRRFRR